MTGSWPEPAPSTEVPHGAPPQQPVYYDAHAAAVSKATASAVTGTVQFARRNNVLAVPALVLSCLGIGTFILAPIGAILGHIARGQIRRNNQTGRGFALAAVLIGWAVTLLYSCGLIVGAIWGFAQLVTLLS